MRRLPVLDSEELTDQQRRVCAEIAAHRGGAVGGPFTIWIRQVAIADCANQLGNALRVSGELEPRVFELAVLVVARHWSADYEWAVHARAALETGLDRDVVEAIRAGAPPSLVREDERAIYALAKELLETHALSQATYDEALEVFGAEQVIEAVGVVGFYAMAAATLVAFQVPAPDGMSSLSDGPQQR
jgi:4-carboxymuconolactone decarboxylase